MYRDGSKLKSWRWTFTGTLTWSSVPYLNCPGSLLKNETTTFGESIYVKYIWIQLGHKISMCAFKDRPRPTLSSLVLCLFSTDQSWLARKPGYGRAVKLARKRPATLPGVGVLALRPKFLEWLDTRWQLVSKWLPLATCAL